MGTRLIQVVQFLNVAPGQHTLAHNINVNDRAYVPDLVIRDNESFTIDAVTSTQITVTNNDAGNATLNAWLQLVKSDERWFGAAQTQNVTPSPFVPAAGGGGGGGGGDNTFSWTLAKTWAQVYAEISAVSGPKQLLVEYDPAGPRVIPAGTYDLNSVWMIGLFGSGVDGYVYTEIKPASGVKISATTAVNGFNNVYLFQSKDIVWDWQDLAGVEIATPIAPDYLQVELDGGRFKNITQPIATGNVTLIMRNRATIDATANGCFVVNNNQSGVWLSSGARLGNRSLYDNTGGGYDVFLQQDGTTFYNSAAIEMSGGGQGRLQMGDGPDPTSVRWIPRGRLNQTDFPINGPATVNTGALNGPGRVFFLNPTGGVITFNMPQASSQKDGGTIAIKNISASINAINIVPSGADTIEGIAGTFPLTTAYRGVILISDGTSGWWILTDR